MGLFTNLTATLFRADREFTKPITAAAQTITLTKDDFGTTFLVSGAAAVTFTLPANGAAPGAWFRVMNVGTDSTIPTIAAATADTLITFNDAAADSVTFGTGHRIGSSVKLISTGSYWVAVNEGNHTMTIATA